MKKFNVYKRVTADIKIGNLYGRDELEAYEKVAAMIPGSESLEDYWVVEVEEQTDGL